uniref:sushi domain-containing protein 3-like n=1 Tax=Myxine glutinosa TaxID=7769 RepID=UPI00358F2BB4
MDLVRDYNAAAAKTPICDLPVEPEHGFMENVVGNEEQGHKLVFTCQKGYRIMGEAVAICTSTKDGRHGWNAAVPFCKAVAWGHLGYMVAVVISAISALVIIAILAAFFVCWLTQRERVTSSLLHSKSEGNQDTFPADGVARPIGQEHGHTYNNLSFELETHNSTPHFDQQQVFSTFRAPGQLAAIARA